MTAVVTSWCTTVLTGVALLLAALYSYIGLRFRYWRSRGVPYRRPSIPFGNMSRCFLGKMSMGMDITEICKEVHGERFVGVYALLEPILVIMDPALIHCVLVRDFEAFYDRGINLDEKMQLNRQLYCLTGNSWKRLRLKLEPTLAPSKLTMMYHAMEKYARRLCKVLEAAAANGDVIDVQEFMERYVNDVIASVVFGVKANSLRNPDSEFLKWVRKFFTKSITTMPSIVALLLNPTLLKILRLIGEKKHTAQYFMKLARYTVSFRATNKIVRNDFMQLLIQLRNVGALDDCKGKNCVESTRVIRWKLPLEDIEATALMFLFGAFESTSASLSFALHELAVNQGVQRRLQQELDAAAGHALLNMDYLDRVVAETLRKYPVVPVLNRKASKDYSIPGSGVTIQKGTPVMIPVYALHHDPVFFPEPERFDPERFSERGKVLPWAYLPFGDGPRKCLGVDFALLQVKCGLAHILSEFNVDICEKTKTRLEFSAKSFILAPDGGIHLRLSKRNSRRVGENSAVI